MIKLIVILLPVILNAQTIVCYGTSLTASGEYPETLQQYLPEAKVINSGAGGMNSNWGLMNVQEKVINLKPDIVLMEFSINDAYNKKTYWNYTVDFYDSRFNYKDMINLIRTSLPECRIILMTMQVPYDSVISGRNPSADRPYIYTYYQICREVAEEENLELIDLQKKWEQVDFLKYAPDGLHNIKLAAEEIIIPEILKVIK